VIAKSCRRKTTYAANVCDATAAGACYVPVQPNEKAGGLLQSWPVENGARYLAMTEHSRQRSCASKDRCNPWLIEMLSRQPSEKAGARPAFPLFCLLSQ
jgi:hypothetical protein